MSALPAIINAASSFASNIYNDVANDRRFERSVREQYRMMEYKNMYDSPSAQVQRLKEAGLNPNLIYSTNPHSPSASGSVGTPPSSTLDLSTASAIYMQDRQLKLQEKQLELQEKLNNADIAKKEAERVNTEQDTQNKKEQNVYQSLINNSFNEKNQLEFSMLKENIENARKSGVNLDIDALNKQLQAQHLKVELDYKDDIYIRQIKKLDADINASHASMLNALEDLSLKKDLHSLNVKERNTLLNKAIEEVNDLIVSRDWRRETIFLNKQRAITELKKVEEDLKRAIADNNTSAIQKSVSILKDLASIVSDVSDVLEK